MLETPGFHLFKCLTLHHNNTNHNKTMSATSDVVPHETRHVAKTRLTIANLAAQPDNSNHGRPTHFTHLVSKMSQAYRRINVLV